jgi:hypothetical protein
MKKHQGVEDMLSSMVDGEVNLSEINDQDIFVPEKCHQCNTATVCSILPSFLGLSKIKVVVEVKACPYFTPYKKPENVKV